MSLFNTNGSRPFYAKLLLLLAGTCFLTCCRQSQDSNETAADTEVRTPVTTTTIEHGPVREILTLNATASFLQNSYVKSNINGFVKKVTVKLGDHVQSGQILFILKTREAEAIGNAVNNLNPDFKFSGTNNIPAGASGFIAELNHQPGDYVQEGEQLAVISDAKSFAFMMHVPYEDRNFVTIGSKVDVLLPDGTKLPGRISSEMPTMDSISQTQTYTIRVNPAHPIPQNLIATVNIIKMNNPEAATLPKGAILSDQTLSEYWVMKLINDSTAVKIPIKKGVETNDRIEILSPDFSSKDKILLTGNYGLADTAFVKVQN